MTILKSHNVALVERELFQKQSLRPKRTPDHITILCPFHRENSPSCNVNLSARGVPVGYFYCWGCNAKGPWNVLADKIGLKKMNYKATGFSVVDNVGSVFDKVRQKTLTDNSSAGWSDLDPELDKVSFTEVDSDWRGIKRDLLVALGCKMFIDRKRNIRICLPVVVNDETVGLVYGTTVKYDPSLKIASYINSPGNWTKNKALLGLDYAKTLKMFKRHKFLILVEGPRDALVLLQRGIPAVAVLGNNWGEKKSDILAELELNHIFLLFDNDSVGRKLGRAAKESLSKHMPVTKFKLPHKEDTGKKIDPASMSLSMLRKIMARVKAHLSA